MKVFGAVSAFSSELGANPRWKMALSRTPHNLVGGPEHKGLDIIQHAFAPQGGGRIEDAMRRLTAAPRVLASWIHRVEA